MGSYSVRRLSGTRTVFFDESDRFGPSLVNMRTGELSMIPEKGYGWFWRFYNAWREAGRPTTGAPMSTPNGPLQRAAWPTEALP
jgi:hypothetical protein